MKKVVSILLAMTILCSLFTGCVTNNNSTSDTSPAGNSTTTNDTKTYRMALIQPQNNLDYFNFITASAQKYADANGIELLFGSRIVIRLRAESLWIWLLNKAMMLL